MGGTRVTGRRRTEQDITLEETYGENGVRPQDLSRALELPAKWALRRDEGLLTLAEMVPRWRGDVNEWVTARASDRWDGALWQLNPGRTSSLRHQGR